MRRNNRIIRTPRKILPTFYKAELQPIKSDKSEVNYFYAEQPKKQEEMPLQEQQTYCLDDSEQLYIMSQLEKIDYEIQESEGYYLQMQFTEIVKNHIKFISYRPYSLTITGSNLLIFGRFHILWWKVIEKQPFMKLEIIKNLYYQSCRYIVKNQQEQFQQLFNSESPSLQNHQSSMENMGSIYNNNCSYPLPLSPEQIDKNCVYGEKENIENFCQSKSYSNSSILSSSKTSNILTEATNDNRLLYHGHKNSRVIAGEIACLFLRIPQERVYCLENVEIVNVLQNYCQKQFELAVVEAISPDEKQPKLCVITYKIYNLEQLLRIQHSYGLVHGFITYDVQLDICQYLKDQMKDKAL